MPVVRPRPHAGRLVAVLRLSPDDAHDDNAAESELVELRPGGLLVLDLLVRKDRVGWDPLGSAGGNLPGHRVLGPAAPRGGIAQEQPDDFLTLQAERPRLRRSPGRLERRRRAGERGQGERGDDRGNPGPGFPHSAILSASLTSGTLFEDEPEGMIISGLDMDFG